MKNPTFAEFRSCTLQSLSELKAEDRIQFKSRDGIELYLKIEYEIEYGEEPSELRNNLLEDV